jgi:hypothetical protein
MRSMRSFVVVSSLALVLSAAPAHAYLDPGIGSYALQMALAAIVSVGFVVRAYWQRLRGLFSRRDPRPPASPPEER